MRKIKIAMSIIVLVEDEDALYYATNPGDAIEALTLSETNILVSDVPDDTPVDADWTRKES